MIKVMEDFGNPFEEDSQYLLVLDTKEIAPLGAVDALRRAHKVGQVQFDNFVRERLVERMKPIEDAIHRNKLKIFGQPTKPQAQGKQQMKSLKNDVDLVCISGARTGMGIWTNSSNMKTKLALLHYRTAVASILVSRLRSELLACLEDFSQPRSEVPPTSCIVLDGAVIIQLLKPATAKSFNEYAQQVFGPYIRPILKTPSSQATGPGVGPPHCRLVEGHNKSQAGKRGEKTSGGWCNYTRELGQLPQSRQE